MKYPLATLTVIFLWGCFAQAQLQQEIVSLQEHYGNSKKYPIIIVDKQKVRDHLQAKNLLAGSEAKIAEALKDYYKDQVALTLEESLGLVPYFTVLNAEATSLPLYQSLDGRNKISKCFVLPSGVTLTHHQEVERALGSDPKLSLYSDKEISFIKSKLSLEHLQFFSLYHELSHCLDSESITSMGKGSADPHSLHKAEVFAEVHALLMLYQRKELRNLSSGRAALRGLYTKNLGRHLATTPPGLAGDLRMKGGSIYFLANALIKTQIKIDDFQLNVKNMSRDETLSLARLLTRENSLSGKGFSALHFSLADDKKTVLNRYRELATKTPELFLNAYLELESAWNYMDLLQYQINESSD